MFTTRLARLAPIALFVLATACESDASRREKELEHARALAQIEIERLRAETTIREEAVRRADSLRVVQEQQQQQALRNSLYGQYVQAVQALEFGTRRSLMESSTLVLQVNNPGVSSIDAELRCYRNDGAYKTFRIAFAPNQITEIGYLEGWPGNFVPGERCEFRNNNGEVIRSVRING